MIYFSKISNFARVSMAPDKVCFFLILYFVNLDFGLSDDSFYKKFHQSGYKIEFERHMVTFVNESYAEVSFHVFKYNRTQFSTNATLLLNVDADYDIEVIVQMYKFLSNEYRTFPLRFEYNLCKAFKYNAGGMIDSIHKCGYFNCPMKKNITYYVCNCVLDDSKLPPFIPTGRFKLESHALYKDVLIGAMESYFRIYEPMKTGKRLG